MNAVKVDEAHRIQLSVLKPGELYQPEIHGSDADEITLRRLKPSLEGEFEKLAEQWRKETFFHSSLSIKYTHPAYQRIIGMGAPVLPFILKDLEKTPERWFYALKFITGEDAAQGVEGFEAAREAWLSWGRQHSYL